MIGQRRLLLAVLLFTCLLSAHGKEEKKEKPKHYNIILIGATGDLAQKYLWRSLFELFSKTYVKEHVQFLIYGCARKEADEGRKILSEILLNTIKCYDVECREMKKSFVEAIQYHQLKTEKQYEELDSKVSENTKGLYAMLDAEWTYEVGRLVYLSIPPSQYPKSIEMVHKHLRPRIARNVWMRLVLEKPFGHDLDSARDLSIALSQHFKEEEIFRIDHYLGKTVVKHILPFRYVNREQYEPLWNSQHIERVEIVAKEKVDVKGRTGFYDEVGIVRDMMQNHLTEVFSLLAMELPEDSGNIADILRSKNRLLQQVEDLSEQSVLLGQYSSYNREVKEESKGGGTQAATMTPTFGAAILKVNNARWRGTPFVLMSGKKMDEKASYVRIVFRDSNMCMSANSNCSQTNQLIFYIGGSDRKHSPMVIATDSLPEFKERTGWKVDNIKTGIVYFGQSINKTQQMIPEHDDDAYTNLVQAVFDGERHLFVDTDCLLASWDIWTKVLRMTETTMPQIYHGKDLDPELLQYQLLRGGGLKFNTEQDILRVDAKQDFEFSHVPATFRGQSLVSGMPAELINKLASDIENQALTSIRSRGVFHLAISGGRSPIQLLKTLASPPFFAFPWRQTHIWFVDERCVALDDVNSNFATFQAYILDSVSIPYINIHPMPVHLSEDFCSDSGDSLYEAAIRARVPDQQMDFILLGVGTDGHTASLFPNQTVLSEANKLVVFADGGPKSMSQRMTMTFPMINKAKSVGILVTGSGKHNIIETLSANTTDVNVHPVTNVKPTMGNLTWYIDNDAFFGRDFI